MGTHSGRPAVPRAMGAALLLALALPRAGHAEAPRVVVTIKPVHSLVSGVMAGVGAPALLLPDGASPHSYAMRPADARLLRGADLIVWVGRELESFLERPLRTLGRDAEVIELLGTANIRLLPVRGTRGRAGGRHRNDHGDRDAHIWLDPANAVTIARTVGDRLGKLDPANGPRYANNAETLERRLAVLDREIGATLAPIRHVPFYVYHDFLQYLERRYALNGGAALTLSPERGPGARRVGDARRRILAGGVRCVFSEPGTGSALVGALIRDSGALGRSLDPMGFGVAPGSTAYFAILRAITNTMASCLELAGPESVRSRQ